MKKLLLALFFWGSVLCTPVFAKTFVGVLWPMFGPLPAIGLVELVAELKLMPDVEVTTYLHQNWPSLVEDLERQPPGTRTVVAHRSEHRIHCQQRLPSGRAVQFGISQSGEKRNRQSIR